ncbi:ribosomal RNA-processing protein 8 [Pseudophryne corroboree]|uniref:ribosomal RNA-processing protein 8 n=1 Tax=Pseudophryne corroboree TaxID=495146 RepID=UPI0030819216
MFATCDWNDNIEAQSLTESLVSAQKRKSTASVTHEKGANSRKKRLKRNRQLLEVLQTLKTPSASDPDLQPPLHLNPPEKQRKTAPVHNTTKAPPPETLCAQSPPPDSGKRLSRQQWRNKLKNKRKIRNKFKIIPESGGRSEDSAEDGKTGRGHTLASGDQDEGQPEGLGVGADQSEDVLSLPRNRGSRIKVGVQKKPLQVNGGKRPSEGVQRNADDSAPRQVTPLEKARLKKLKKIMQREDCGGNPKDNVRDSEEPDNGETGKQGPDSLRSRMEQRLSSARFRYINQQLYTSDSQDALSLFQDDPEAFSIYHTGFSQQVQRWPVNPITEIIKYVKNRPSSLVVADFGCGDALLARSVRNKVHSYDLVALNDHVTVCDIAQVPLSDGTIDIAVFCLSLMGKNLADFLQEANRVLKLGGTLLVAEVSSRFDDIRPFLSAMSQLGFKSVSKNTDNHYFFTFEFSKVGPARDTSRHSGLQLKPCLYKKR